MITYHLRRGKNIRLYQQVWSTMVNMITLFGSISWHINVGIIIGINCMRINMQGKCSMSSFFPTGEDRGQSYGLFPVTGKEYWIWNETTRNESLPNRSYWIGIWDLGVKLSQAVHPQAKVLRTEYIYDYLCVFCIYTYNHTIILYHIILYYIIYYIILYYIISYFILYYIILYYIILYYIILYYTILYYMILYYIILYYILYYIILYYIILYDIILYYIIFYYIILYYIYYIR